MFKPRMEAEDLLVSLLAILILVIVAGAGWYTGYQS